jgi:hypothetical protein
MKLLIVQYSQSSYFLLLGSKYYLHHFLLEQPVAEHLTLPTAFVVGGSALE